MMMDGFTAIEIAMMAMVAFTSFWIALSVASSTIGLFFARKMRRRNYTTLLDPFEHHYGKRAAAWLFLPALLGELFRAMNSRSSNST